MIEKVLVANRGEIAIRALRAATELGLRTVAVYPYEDRHSLHRQKADESYEIGERGRPLRAYLNVASIVDTAVRAGADAVYPGYGFLSENPDLADACAARGLVFVGPPAAVLSLAGNKVRALEAARDAGLPTLRTTAPLQDTAELLAAAADIGFPLFVKATAGGGGRGLRRVETAGELAAAIDAARREAESAFGDPTVFLEQAVTRPRHIEVQVLADAQGEVVHLFERDCSIQRRHQKVIEVAPAPNLDPRLRERICADAVGFARHIGYRNAGTVEFLLDAAGRYVFIEMNPRIQVEHTVTEEITSVDLVQAQLRIADGHSLADLGLAQESIRVNGAALQCRITTEDPTQDFRPDIGRITAYRSPGGAGVRLDGSAYAGAEISPHFDSLLVKLTCRGRDHAEAAARARRALAEFRVRGVATNIAFLRSLLEDADFAAGRLTTSFIEERPELLRQRASADRGTKLLTYLAETTVNRPFGTAPTSIDPRTKLPDIDLAAAPAAGGRQRLTELGPAGFASWLRAGDAVAVTDTTFRDAHQSLLATRVRTHDLVAVAGHIARMTPQLLSVEAWGGATYDVALRFLKESPWERLAALREAMPNLCLQMLLRGRNTVGYTPYPDKVAEAFVAEAATTGVDIFRVFDALNNVDQMLPAIRAVIGAGAVAEGTICYTGDLADPAETLYDLDYYLTIADQLVAAGVHILCVKDMAGLLRAPAARILVSALRARFDVPVHLHTHDTAGGQLATYLAAIESGVDAVDGACAALAGTTSQPALSAIVAATDHTPRQSGLSLRALCELEPYWEAMRNLYAPFESGLRAPTGRVYQHEIPGGQLTNLRQQAIALGLGDRFELIERLYAAANRILGNIVKVTPTSKVVGDLALHLSATGVDPQAFEADPGSFDLPLSVVGFLAGDFGTPAAGWPEPFRGKALAGRAIPVRAAELTAAQEAGLDGGEVRATLDELLFPGPAQEYREAVRTYGELTAIPTRPFFFGLVPGDEIAVSLERGVDLLVELEAVGDADERGMRTVLCKLNGALRAVSVRDKSADVSDLGGEHADPSDPHQVAAPFAGVVSVAVAVGETVAAGQLVATIEAMKMEANITAPRAGVVERIAVGRIAPVEPGDLLVVLRDQ